jgi:hypothetical protein
MTEWEYETRRIDPTWVAISRRCRRLFMVEAIFLSATPIFVTIDPYSTNSRERTFLKSRSISEFLFLNQSVDQIRCIAHP